MEYYCVYERKNKIMRHTNLILIIIMAVDYDYDAKAKQQTKMKRIFKKYFL